MGFGLRCLTLNHPRLSRCLALIAEKSPTGQLFFGSVLLGRHNLLAAIETVRADVVTAMHFAAVGFNSDGRIAEEVMSTMIAALAGRFFILLDSHFLIPHVG